MYSRNSNVNLVSEVPIMTVLKGSIGVALGERNAIQACCRYHFHPSNNERLIDWVGEIEY